MKLSYIFSLLLGASLLAGPIAYAKGDHVDCIMERQQELTQTLTLDANQKKLWDAYTSSVDAQKANFLKIKELHDSMRNIAAQTAVEAKEKRLATRQQMLVIENNQITQMKTSLAALKSFYNSLNASQKAEFDANFKKVQEKQKACLNSCKETCQN